MSEEKKSYRQLFLALYAIILFSTGNKSPEIKQTVTDPENKKYFDDVQYLKESLSKVVKGKTFSLTELATGLKEFTSVYKALPNARPGALRLLKAFQTYCRSGSTEAWATIEQNSSSEAFPEWVRSAFIKKVASQSPLSSKLQVLVQTMVGRRGEDSFADIEESKVAKAKYPEKYAEYLKLRRQYNKVWQDEVSNYIRESGNRTVPYQDLLNHLAAKGVVSTLPTGFDGLIDAASRIYTKDNKEISGLPSGTMFPTVKMNPNQHGDWVFQALRADGTGGNYFYTKEFLKERNSGKFEVVNELATKIDRIRNSWKIGINHFDEKDQPTVAAVILELLYTFSARIGSLGNSAGGTATYGLGTVRIKNLTMGTNSFVLRYKGKDAVSTVHKYTATDAFSKKVVDAVASLAEGKGPKEPLFTYLLKNGSRKLVQPTVVNVVFRKLGSGKATVHKLRTLRGTSIFNAEVAKFFAAHKKLDNPKKALDAVKKMAMLVGKELNHVRRGASGTTVTPATALASYIDSSAQIAFFVHYGLPLPNYLAKSKVVEAVNAEGKEVEDEDQENPSLDTGIIEEWLAGELEL